MKRTYFYYILILTIFVFNYSPLVGGSIGVTSIRDGNIFLRVEDSIVNIVSSKTYKKGIYLSFEEFKNNNPSVENGFVFNSERKKLTFPFKESKIKHSKIWGISDGNSVYINYNGFNKLEIIDRYCFFIDKGVKIIFGFSAIPMMILPIPMPYKDGLAINFNNGAIFLLKKSTLKVLMADDKELLEAFKKEPGKKKKLVDYLVKYNSRHQDEIR